MTDQEDLAGFVVDSGAIQTLAAANGLTLTAQRAEDLSPALQVMLEADARLVQLELASYPAAGLPWAYAAVESEL
jgi:hypothetical protein